MNKEQAINIVRETFEAPFDKVRFANFIKGLLNEPDLTDGFGPRSGNYVPDAFKSYVEKYERLGKYTDSEEKRLDILIVYLKRETSIERARSMQRNFIAGYLKGNYGSTTDKDAALVAFVSPNPQDWRFSLVKLDYRLEVDEKGKAKGHEEFTPAKRWSFLVGANEKSHTAQTQFQPILKDDENNPTLEQLEAAFNIEKVTDEFFREYRRLFIETKEALDKAVEANPATRSDFEAKNINTVDLSKKLLGQIIFLYYLQKKGWFGVPRDGEWGEGSKNFLRELFTKCNAEKKNFFNDVLEPLFYEALRLDRSHEDHYYKLFDCKIPFLNGGLFDPMNNYDWVKTEILLPNTLFSNGLDTSGKNTRSTRPSGSDEGDGILDVFDLYNFTVKEDEPFEKEVAIDPELLGKAYEKFNAIRPDNYDEFLQALKSGKKGEESKFNKQYGVYYTPREIVHYMCQQSLINYLHSELNVIASERSSASEAILNDEEITSGKVSIRRKEQERPRNDITKEDIATLILRGEQIKENDERVLAAGKETDTYSFLMPDSIRQNASLIDLKLASVKVCDPAVGSGAFPVGMMSEIVKARGVLAIYPPVLSDIPPFSPSTSLTDEKSTAKMGGTRGVYHFKRQCIENSLYGVDIDAGAVEIAKLRLWLSLIVDEDDIQNIKPLPNLDYKIVQGNSLLGVEKDLFNLPLFKQLETTKLQYFNETVPSNKQNKKNKIDALINQITNGHSEFDFQIYFSEVFHEKEGFDVIIGNPPYLESRHPDFSDKLKDAYQSFSKKRWLEDTVYITRGADLLIYFFENSIFNIRGSGQVVFLTQNSWLDTEYGKKFQKFLLKNTQVKRVIDSDFKYFSSNDGPNINAVITVFEGKRIISPSEIVFARYHQDFELMSTPNILLVGDEDAKFVETHKYSLLDKRLKDIKWGVLLSASDEILDLLEVLDSKGISLANIKSKGTKFSYGQGLNLSKDYIVSSDQLKELKFAQKAKIPFLTSDDGAIFSVRETKHYLLNETHLSKDEIKQLKSSGIIPFNPNQTRKIPPVLMLPRGISKHHCVLNYSKAYSSSYVDIYCFGEESDTSIILNLWAFYNSTVGWLLREINGRKNLGGGLLKAEAVDLENLPVYLNLDKSKEIQSIVQKIEKRKALNTINEIDTPEHQNIDDIIFDYLGIRTKDRTNIINILKTKLSEREGKAKS